MSTDAPDLGYLSHLPVLSAVLSEAPKDCCILECGCGHGSTHLTHLFKKGRGVISLDTDEKWLKTFEHYQNSRHHFVLIRAEVPKGSSGVNEYIAAWVDRIKGTDDNKVVVAFVDCWPGEARVPIIQALKGKAFAIVAHDLEADEPPGGGNYGWKKLDGLFKYHRVFKRLRPWTGFWSDHFDMPELE